jgi:CHAT domain/Caspase domain
MALGPSPQTTLAVVTGASVFKRSPDLAQGKRFKESADEFLAYLRDPDGFNLPERNLLNLFDSDEPPDSLLEQIENFLEEHLKPGEKEPAPQDLLFYYLGHGGFTADNKYRLAVARTRPDSDSSSIRMVDLAKSIKNKAAQLRKYLILDCCFAAEAFKYFQSNRQSTPGEAAQVELRDALAPATGTTMLCSSSAIETSKAPEEEKYTMFSGALLQTLRKGITRSKRRITMAQLGESVGMIIRQQFKDEAVRPQVFSPDQDEDDLKDIELFPNPALRLQNFDWTITVVDNHTVQFAFLDERGKPELLAGLLADPLAKMTVQRLNEWVNIGIRLDQEDAWKGNWEADDLKLLGVNLYRMLFGNPQARQAFTTVYQRFQAASKETPDLRMRVRLTFKREAEEVARWPWEFLFIPDGDNSTEGFYFCGKRTELNLVRYVAATEEPPAAKVEALKILVLICRPFGDSGFSLIEEETLVGKLKQIANTKVEVLRDPTMRKLLATLEALQPHVIHFVGYGAVDEKGKFGLALVGQINDPEDRVYKPEDKKPVLPTAGDMLFNLFGDETRARLVFLHGCKTGVGAEAFRSQDALKQCARELAFAKTATVITMQYATPHDEIGAFAAEVYGLLASGHGPDEAAKAGRNRLGQSFPPRWAHPRFAAPVVFLQNDEPLVLPAPSKPTGQEKPEEKKDEREAPPAAASAVNVAATRPPAVDVPADSSPSPSPKDRPPPSSSFQNPGR